MVISGLLNSKLLQWIGPVLFMGALVVQIVTLWESNRVNDHLDSVYRVVVDGSEDYATSMPPVGKALHDYFEEVVSYTTTRKGKTVSLGFGEKKVYTKNYLYVDSDFFEVFQLQVTQGSINRFRQRSNVIAVTEEFAESQLQGIDVVGTHINLDGKAFEVVALIGRNKPIHLDFDFIVPLTAFEVPDYATLGHWAWLTFYNYVKLAPGADVQEILTVLQDFLKERAGERIANAISLDLQPARSIPSGERFSEDGAVIQTAQKLANHNSIILHSWYLVFAVLIKTFLRLPVRTTVIYIAVILPLLLTLSLWALNRMKYEQKLSSLHFDPSGWILEFDHPDLKQKFGDFKKALLQHEEISEVGGGNHIMEGIHGTYTIYPTVGNKRAGDGMRMNFYPIYDDFFSSMGIQNVMGEKFAQSQVPSDTIWKLAINERAAEELGIAQDPLGATFFIAGQGGMHGQVTRVVDNFHFDNMGSEIPPLVCFYRQDAFDFVIIPISSQGGDEELKVIEEEFTRHYPGVESSAKRHFERSDFILANDLIKLRSSRNLFFLCVSLSLTILVYFMYLKLRK